MTALLGLLAIAGYQNRGAEYGQRSTFARRRRSSLHQVQTGHRVVSRRNSAIYLAAQDLGGLLGGGLRDLVDSFKSSGQGEIADSSVAKGPNKSVSPQELERAIRPEVLATLSAHSGLSREELLSRLARQLPEAMTVRAGGRLPPPV